MNTIAPPTTIKGPENSPNSFTVGTPPFNPFSSTPPPDPIASGQTIEVNPEKPNTTPPPQTVNFQTPDFLSGFVAQKTIENKDTPPIINQPLTGTDNSLNEEDFQMASEFLITAYDFGLGAFCRWYAGDITDAPYMLSESRKKPLIKLLTKMLVRAQSKFSIEIMFFVMLILAGVTPFIKATNKRDENKKKKIEEDKKKAESLKVVKPPPPSYSNPYNNEAPKREETTVGTAGPFPAPKDFPATTGKVDDPKQSEYQRALVDIETLTGKYETAMVKKTDKTLKPNQRKYHEKKAHEFYLQVQSIGARYKIPTPMQDPRQQNFFSDEELQLQRTRENDIPAITPKVEIVSHRKPGMPLPGKRTD